MKLRKSLKKFHLVWCGVRVLVRMVCREGHIWYNVLRTFTLIILIPVHTGTIQYYNVHNINILFYSIIIIVYYTV